MIRFKDFISEGIALAGNRVSIDYKNNDGDVVGLKMGKRNRMPFKTGGRMFDGHEVFSSYVVDTKIPGAKDIMVALKGKHPDLVVGEEDLDHFLNRTTQHLLATVLKGKSIDLVVTIKSSSNLTKRFAEQFTRRINNQVFFPAAITKAAIDKVKVSDDVPNEKMRKDIQRVIDNVKTGKTAGLEIKKLRPQDRQFLVDFLELDEKLVKKIEGKNILIVDDYVTSGNTIAESMRLLELYAPNDIFAVTLFKVG